MKLVDLYIYTHVFLSTVPGVAAHASVGGVPSPAVLGRPVGVVVGPTGPPVVVPAATVKIQVPGGK